MAIGGREIEIEDRAASRSTPVPDAPAHRVDDPVAHGQAKPRALTYRFRGEERLEQLCFVLGRDTGDLRLPMTPLEPDQEAKLRKTLTAYGLL